MNNKDPNEVADVLEDIASKLRCGRMSCINFNITELVNPDCTTEAVKYVGSGRRRVLLEVKEEK
jgi:hypothetical protein